MWQTGRAGSDLTPVNVATTSNVVAFRRMSSSMPHLAIVGVPTPSPLPRGHSIDARPRRR
jgi:hypothetical protein